MQTQQHSIKNAAPSTANDKDCSSSKNGIVESEPEPESPPSNVSSVETKYNVGKKLGSVSPLNRISNVFISTSCGCPRMSTLMDPEYTWVQVMPEANNSLLHSERNESRFAPTLLTKSPSKVSVFSTGVTVGATDPSIVGESEGDVDVGNEEGSVDVGIGEGIVVVGIWEGLRVGVLVDGLGVGTTVGCMADGINEGFFVGPDVVGVAEGKNVGFVDGSLVLGEIVGLIDGTSVGIFDGA